MANTNNSATLAQGLGMREALSLVIGTVIGAGVFMKAAVMLQTVGSFSYVMLAWVLAGVLSLAGAFCFAELGSRFPEAGGEYTFLREAFGEYPAFLNGWMRFAIGNPGSLAAYAVGMATLLRGVYDLTAPTQTLIACGTIAVLSALNCFTVRAAGMFHAALTALKMILIVGFTLALLRPTPTTQVLTWTAAGWPGWRAFGSAMLAALWCYDGWNGMPMAAGEVRDGHKNIPRALVLGMLAVIVIYLLSNLAFFRTLSPGAIVASNSPLYPDALPVATNAAMASLGPGFVAAVSILLAFSTLVALNGSILTCARLPFAMAQDGVLFSWLGAIHPRWKTPAVSVVVQGVIAVLIACSGTFDQLTDYVMFASWIFYGLSVLALFALRRRPAPSAGFKTPFYPVLPFVFLLVSLWLVVNTLLTAPRESLIGLGLILAGTPFYIYFRRQREAA